MLRSDFEIMAPVGSRESLFAAFQAKADSVYFGVGKLNMRAQSSNPFTTEDLGEIVGLCHERGVRAYLTVNTEVYQEELPEMKRILAAAKASGVDAVIAADAATLAECSRLGLEVHLSTQMDISNVESLRFYAKFADVVVLARELTLPQVAEIHRAIESEPILGPSGKPVRIEMFAHGALCLGVSGRCFMSLGTRGKSGNRGECLQTCRRAYIVKDEQRDIELRIDNRFIMSPKDLKTIGFLDLMVKAGVRVFKIEGRARGPEYVRTVVECYDEALRMIAAGTYGDSVRAKWDERLLTVFNRGFWDGYYLGSPVAEIMKQYGSKATERKVFLGKCINFWAKPSVGDFRLLAGSFRRGEKLLVTGPTTGAVWVDSSDFEIDGARPDEAPQGSEFQVKVPEKVRPNDQLYVLRHADR